MPNVYTFDSGGPAAAKQDAAPAAGALSREGKCAMVGKAVGVAPRRGRIPISMLLAAAHLSEAIARPLRIDAPLQVRQCDFFTKDRAFDISKARELLGYNPTVELPDGLGRTAKWYLNEGLLG